MQRNGKMLRFLSLMVGILLVFTAQAFAADLLVTPADIEKNMGKWIVIDCRDAVATDTIKGYSGGHIPGAISLGGQCSKVLRTSAESIIFYDDKLNPDVAKYEKILGDAGITSDKTVVVYADVKGITSASVGYWILELFGQKDVRFLNGGIEAWEAAGKKLDTVEKKLPSAKYNANLMKSSIATTDEVLKVAKGTVKNVQIVDSRTPGEYAGTDVRAKRGGHIPTTVLNVSHVETFDSKTGMIKSTEELEKLFGKLDKNKRTIPYCHTGTRSTLLYLIFETMGFKDVANYDDSWIIWGNREDTPIEK
ncbi:MAG: hypothetical protein A2Z09_02920 [Nitrospirae bacterium RBG_16_43_8]|nr:MAG: hypothetical protein A2Z09_02920 [Nitrospirae bacterium RBG_16_43_8]